MITTEFIKSGEPQTDELRAMSRAIGKTETSELVIQQVCDIFKITEEEIKGKERFAECVDARHIAMYILLDKELSLTEVGKIFDRHHATVIHARDRVCECTERTNKRFYNKLKLAGIV